MSVEQHVAAVPVAQYSSAHDALIRAFFTYPLMVYAAPDERRRASGVRALYGAILRDCLRHGEVHSVADVRGVACWLPPGVGMPNLWRQIRSGMWRLPLDFGTSAVSKLVDYDNAARGLHHEHAPENPWYLAAIGVVPEQQGRGLGSSLLEPMTARADDQRAPCYLETHREENVRLYERHGFEVVCRHDVPGHSIPIWAMTRLPR